MKKIFLIMLSSVLLISCGTKDRQIESYGDITVSEGGIALTNIAEHRGGWERNECLMCHNVHLNVHRGPNSNIDINELNERIRNNQGSKYCLTCHGTNGAPLE